MEENRKRHTCIWCGKKRYEEFMEHIDVKVDRETVYSHWVCKSWYYSSVHCKEGFIRSKLDYHTNIIKGLEKYRK